MVASICDSVNSHLLNNIRDIVRLKESIALTFLWRSSMLLPDITVILQSEKAESRSRTRFVSEGMMASSGFLASGESVPSKSRMTPSLEQ